MSLTDERVEKLVGVEVSTGNFNAVTINEAGDIIDSRKEPFDTAKDPIEQLCGFIGGLRDQFGDFNKVGIAIPGLVDKKTNRVAFSSLMPGNARVDIVREVSASTGITATIENDANAAAFGEYRLGAGRGSSDLFYATIGKGIGGALIFGGEIWRGVSGFAGEFGNVTINSDGLRLEDVASAENIVRRTRDRIYQDSTSSLSKLDEQELTISDIVSAAAEEDDFAILMLERTGTYVGSAIASVVNLLNIERVVIGGEVMLAGGLVLDAIVRRAREFSFPPSYESTSFVSGQLGLNAAAIGVAMLSDH
ncbi:MAG: ROK family protein [Blastocatellia bacterium]